MKELDFQTKFTRWAKYNLPVSTACELKITNGPSLPFDSVADHQLIALKLAKGSSGAGYKIPDCGISAKPFDFFFLIRAHAYIVVMFYKRAQKEFFVIDVDAWEKETLSSDRKSLTEDRAREICEYVGLLA